MGKTDIKVKIKKRATASTTTRLDRVEAQRPLRRNRVISAGARIGRASGL